MGVDGQESSHILLSIAAHAADVPWSDLNAAFRLDLLAKLALAVVLGGAIGLEREVKAKPAGLRTNILICIGAVLLTDVSIRIGLVDGGPRVGESDFSIRNRTTGDLTKFTVTHAPDPGGMSLPVQIFYQPSFWLSVELRLDDAADVPADPDKDGSVLTRIRAICASAR